MLTPGQDDVSNIHRRWSFATIGPSSSRISYTIWLLCAGIIIVASHLYHLQAGIEGLVIYVPLGFAALIGSHYLDYLALHGTPVNKLSKVAHVSAFANGLWALTVCMGIAADLVFAKRPGIDYIIAGMLLAAGLRIGIFTSVFGASIGRAILVSFIQPVIFLFAFVPYAMHSFAAFTSLGLAFGLSFLALGIGWTFLADRAGRPGIKSTFGILQAFIAAWTEHKAEKLEEFTEAKAHDDIVTTKVIQFDNLASIILPDIHPGPFNTVGGSNLPFVLYENFNKHALVMHSVSDHSLNIPSKKEVDKYLKGLASLRTIESGNTCTVPTQFKMNNSTATGIAFGNAAMIMLSLAPKGMDDIPQSVRTELEFYGTSLGFSDVLIVDCHNAMGKNLDDSDKNDLILAARQCLEQLKKELQHEFKIGFANVDHMAEKLDLSSELGEAGLAAIVINVAGKNYAIGWADSNNMDNTLRNHVVSKANGNFTLLELCSSDTHATSGKRTREGYFALGTVYGSDMIATAFFELCNIAANRAEMSRFDFRSTQSTVKVMGKKQFEDYSIALDKSMSVTKIFVAITFATYLAMLVFS